MAYTFNVTEHFEVIVKEDNNEIDKVGAFDSFASAEYWATQMSAKFADSDMEYPGE